MASPVWDQIAGSWKQLKGDVRAKWGELTDDELEQAAGNRDKLAGYIQQRYGMARADADRALDDWAEHLDFNQYRDRY
jgi:uncharacterized protein YjbJ (UPF0337 family)